VAKGCWTVTGTVFVMFLGMAWMSLVACWANVGKMSGRKPEKWPGIAFWAPQGAQQVGLFSGGLQSPHHRISHGSSRRRPTAASSSW